MKSTFIINVPTKSRNGWAGSNIEPLVKQTGQFKNRIGAEIVKQTLNEQNVPCCIDENGNLNFKDNKVSEIRTAFASFQGERKTFWFNQIRPKLDNWSHMHLVCVHPEKVEVYELTKYEVLELCKEAAGLDHIGQDGLLAIKVSQGKHKGDYWKLDCYGKKITEFSTEKIKLNETK